MKRQIRNGGRMGSSRNMMCSMCTMCFAARKMQYDRAAILSA